MTKELLELIWVLEHPLTACKEFEQTFKRIDSVGGAGRDRTDDLMTASLL
jgi:hypothetical protein